MLIHYCVIAFKNIWKYKVSASISILGLAFALVCFVPILYWMDHETTYDSFYKDSESIYRVYSVEKQSGKVNKGASKGIENSLREQVPAIEASTTLMLSTENCRTQATPYIQMNMLYTDSTFLEVFPQSFVCGEMNHPLQIINNMILSERTGGPSIWRRGKGDRTTDTHLDESLLTSLHRHGCGERPTNPYQSTVRRDHQP